MHASGGQDIPDIHTLESEGAEHIYIPFEPMADEQASPFFFTFWSFISSLDVSASWAVQLWELSQRQCPTEDLTVVHAKVAAVAAKVVWEPGNQRRRRAFRPHDAPEITGVDVVPSAAPELDAERLPDSADDDEPGSDIEDEDDDGDGLGRNSEGDNTCEVGSGGLVCSKAFELGDVALS